MQRFPVLCAALLVSSLALAQVPGYYRTGPYVPLITTPSISLQTFSPAPVGARNATAGLMAGARNSTLSMNDGNTSSVYTEAVWYSGGGAPLISSPAVSLEVRPLHRCRKCTAECAWSRAITSAPRPAPATGPTSSALKETSSPVEASTVGKERQKSHAYHHQRRHRPRKPENRNGEVRRQDRRD